MEKGPVAKSTLTKAFFTTVPKAIRSYLKIQPGDKLEWFIINQEVRVAKKVK